MELLIGLIIGALIGAFLVWAAMSAERDGDPLAEDDLLLKAKTERSFLDDVPMDFELNDDELTIEDFLAMFNKLPRGRQMMVKSKINDTKVKPSSGARKRQSVKDKKANGKK